MLHTMHIDAETRPSHVDVLIESVEEEEEAEDNQISLLDSFQEFIKQCVDNQVFLGRRTSFKELLLPN